MAYTAKDRYCSQTLFLFLFACPFVFKEVSNTKAMDHAVIANDLQKT